MSRNLKRLIFALLISVTCFSGTVLWYRAGLKERSKSSSHPALARLTEAHEEVQRRDPKRVMWEPLEMSDEIFAGDSIRTTGKSSAKITLLKSGASVHLEPDSLLVLEETGGGLTLDFLQGQMFLQKTGSSEALTLKTDTGLLKLKDAELNLSKDGKSPASLEMLKGTADYQADGQTFAISDDQSAQLSKKGLDNRREMIKMLAPAAGKTQYLVSGKKDNLKVQWQPLSGPSEVTVELGPSRSQMTAAGKFPGQAGLAHLSIKPGKWFVRLISPSSDPQKLGTVSPAVPVVVERAQPPTLLEPKTDSPVLRSDLKAPVQFRWVTRNSYKHQVFELAKDAQFKEVLKTQRFDGQSNSLQMALPDGRLHWRVTGFFDAEAETPPSSSHAQAIEVLSRWELKPALLIKPKADKKFTWQEVKKQGLELRWKPAPGSQHFQVVVEKEVANQSWQKELETDTEAHSLALANLAPAHYRWRVTSFAAKNSQTGLASENLKFTIAELARMEWIKTGLDDEYATPSPSVRAEWTTFPGATRYRYKVVAEGADLAAANWLETNETFLDVPVKEDGRYVLAVEAVNSEQQTLARADTKVVQLRKRPELKAPEWTAQTPKVLRPDPKGNLPVAWLPVAGAKKYLLIVENSQGDVLQKRSTDRTSTLLPPLKGGTYQVTVKAVDAFERAGAPGPTKSIEVPAAPDIQAPRIKRVKVR